jgi:hypothetical protein
MVRTEHIVRTKMSWHDCCAKWQYGGLNIIDHEETLISLWTKWVIIALEPWEFNLKLILRYWLARCKMSKHCTWKANVTWANIIFPKHIASLKGLRHGVEYLMCGRNSPSPFNGRSLNKRKRCYNFSCGGIRSFNGKIRASLIVR